MGVLMGTTTCNDWRPDLPRQTRRAGCQGHEASSWRRHGDQCPLVSSPAHLHEVRYRPTACAHMPCPAAMQTGCTQIAAPAPTVSHMIHKSLSCIAKQSTLLVLCSL
jgi:hypothetical protein